MYFCSKSCQTHWRNGFFIGKKHSNWTTGISIYRKIIERTGVITACVRCKLVDKRVLSVHHIDHNRLNNDKTNLVWLCFNCHFLVHHDKKVENNLGKISLKVQLYGGCSSARFRASPCGGEGREFESPQPPQDLTSVLKSIPLVLEIW